MSITLERAITLYLNEQQNAATRKTYKTTLEPMAQYIGPARPLTAITPDLLIEYIQHARQFNRTPHAINTRIKGLRTFFNWCVRIGWMSESPARAIKYTKPPINIDRDKAMSDEDYEQLLDYAKWDERAYAVVLFLGDTGCRRGGLAGLEWDDVDFIKNTATVTEKGDKSRPVWFGDECSSALHHWKKVQKRKLDQRHVFTKNGSPCKPESVSSWFNTLCKKAGIKPRGPHSLRHRKGFQLGDNNINPNIGAVALGHDSSSVTMQYYYPRDYDRARRAIDQLSYKRDLKPAKSGQKIVKIERINRS